MNKKRQFTAEFKKEAVALVTEQNYTVDPYVRLVVASK
ncbi:transposase [Salmonella enterica subsp. diarizonae]|nr:transposase [Salmonella enterica subsp. diarizonae]